MKNFESLLQEANRDIEQLSSMDKDKNANLIMSLMKLQKLESAEKNSSETVEILLGLAAHEMRFDSVKRIKSYSSDLNSMIIRGANNHERAIDIILGKLE